MLCDAAAWIVLCRGNQITHNNNNNNNEILIKREPQVYTTAQWAVQKKKKKEEERRLGQYNSNNKLIHGQYTSRYNRHLTHTHTLTNTCTHINTHTHTLTHTHTDTHTHTHTHAHTQNHGCMPHHCCTTQKESRPHYFQCSKFLALLLLLQNDCHTADIHLYLQLIFNTKSTVEVLSEK